MTDSPALLGAVAEQPVVVSTGPPFSGALGLSGMAIVAGLTCPGISYGKDLFTTVVGATGSFCSLKSVNAVAPPDWPSWPCR